MEADLGTRYDIPRDGTVFSKITRRTLKQFVGHKSLAYYSLVTFQFSRCHTCKDTKEKLRTVESIDAFVKLSEHIENDAAELFEVLRCIV